MGAGLTASILGPRWMLTALSPQVLEQRRLLLPTDSGAHVDGVRGQRGPQAAL